MAADPIKLTVLQREVLEALKSGALITLDEHNMPWLAGRALQPQTRYFLTEHRLITRADTARSVEAKGNGFTISAKGLALISTR